MFQRLGQRRPDARLVTALAKPLKAQFSDRWLRIDTFSAEKSNRSSMTSLIARPYTAKIGILLAAVVTSSPTPG